MEFGLLHLWSQMGFIAKSVVIILIACSIWSLYVIIERSLAYSKARKESVQFAKLVTQLLRQEKLQEARDSASKFKFSHLARVTRAGIDEYLLDTRPGAASSTHDIVEAANRAIEREALITAADFKKGVGVLATVATTSPFIGLFGTVFGIIHAFEGLGSGSGGIASVSAGIAEALVTTGIGIGIAIPAAWMYNHFSNKMERFGVEMSNSSSELLDFFIKRQGGAK